MNATSRSEPYASTRIRIVTPDAHELERVLGRAGYRRIDRTDANELVTAGPRPGVDLVIVDLAVPGAAEAALRLAETTEAEPPSILLIGTALPDSLAGRLLALPRADFLRTPLDDTELLLRVRTLLRIRWLHARVDRHAEGEDRYRREVSELEGQRFELLDRLARAVEYKDDETGEHPWRVGRISAHVALAIGLPADLAELVELAAPLHDIGKIAIPDEILLKPGHLEVWEAELMRSHTVVGQRLLAGSRSPILQMAEGIAASHHERWDGTGYPAGLLRGSIPIAARIVALADTYDAMSFDRPYRDALPRDRVLAEIRRESGAQFDPRVVEAFMEEALPRIEAEGLRRTA